MDEQRAFRFQAAQGEALSFARMGMGLDWARVARRGRRLFAAHLAQVAASGHPEVLAAGFSWAEHFLMVALFEEIADACKRQGRRLKREARAQGRRRLGGSFALARTPEGRRAQMVMGQLEERLRAWEAARLCG